MLPQYELNPPCNFAKNLYMFAGIIEKKLHKQSIHAFVDGEESQFSGDELYAMLSMTQCRLTQPITFSFSVIAIFTGLVWRLS